MSLQIIVPGAKGEARPEPDSGVLYRCAASWPICPFCALPYSSNATVTTCAGCRRELPAEKVFGACSMYGVIEVRDLAGGYRGSMCQGHARAALKSIRGARLVVKSSSISELIEERLGVLFAYRRDLQCNCTPGVNSAGANESGDIYCDTCGKLMVGSTMAHLTEQLVALRLGEEGVHGEVPHATN